MVRGEIEILKKIEKSLAHIEEMLQYVPEISERVAKKQRYYDEHKNDTGYIGGNTKN